MEDPGQKLKKVRERLNLKYREVEEASARIAEARGSDEYLIALSRLADIENKGTMPTLYRIYSLCAIYRIDWSEVLSWYGITLENLPADAMLVSLSHTHPIRFQGDGGEVQLPISLDPGIDLNKTQFLSRLIQRWGKLPLLLLKNIDLKAQRYGFIGSEDWSMHPLIPPGSLVVIDESRRRVVNVGWTSEFDRPIYFLEHRAGYAIGWCMVNEGKLILQHHPSSLSAPEIYDYPGEIEVVGQITAVAMTLDPAERRRPG
jgi:transcriptional regulator with XRE-family HTH domain